MVEAKELRKGNYVDIVTCYPKEKIILEIREDSVVTTDGYTRTLPWVHGMYITEERLLKFGFEIKKEGWYLFAIKEFLKFDISSISEEIVILINDKRIALKHIHQLQNLYFALTRNELEW